jgi:protease-4
MSLCVSGVVRGWAGRIVTAMAVALAATGAWGQYRVGSLEVSGAPADEPGPFAWLMGEEDLTLDEIVTALEDAAGRDDLDGVLIRLRDADLGAAQVEEIGAAMRGVEEAGKKVQVFAETYGPADLMLGSYADEVILQAGGGVSLPGLYMEEMYLADALAWIGVKADMVQIGDYKGANEEMTRSAPSAAWDKNISQLLDSLYANQREKLKQGRRLSDAKLDEAMRAAWEADGEEAVAAGLIDAEVDWGAIDDYLGAGHGGKVVWEDLAPGAEGSGMDLSIPLAVFGELERLFSAPSNSPDGPSIGIVHIDGVIVDGESSEGGLMGGKNVGSRTIRNALEDAGNEKDIKGVIVRVDSPGGSAMASEVMWQGIKRLAEKKPVWVSVGSMAASGGYYVSVAGDRIYVNPSSIVGSIGVVGGKYSMGGLYEKLKIHVVGRARGPMAQFESSTEPWSAEQMATVRAKMTRTYSLFTRRVSGGRAGIDLGATAEGRLFTGEKAVGMKMADRVGGLADAVGDMASELGLEEYGVVHYPGPKSLPELLEQGMGGFVQAPRIGAATGAAEVLREAVGARAWPAVRDSIGAMMLLRDEPVVLTMPRALIFR